VVFPKIGNGRVAVVAIKARAGGLAYRNIANTADDDLRFLQGVYGYEHLLVRATGDVATAGAVAFANDTADKIAVGAQIVAGTNAPGYNPTAPIAADTFDCTLAGGGAPGLAAEPALIGKRIRFDSATTTVALRNVCASIHANDTDTITVGTNLPAVPVATDVFYIEEPGLAVAHLFASTANPNAIAPPGFAARGVQVVGVRTVGAGLNISVRGATALFRMAFCETITTAFISTVASDVLNFSMSPSYQDESATPVTILVGTAWRGDGFTASSAIDASLSHYHCIAFRPQILNVGQYTCGSASYAAAGILVQGCATGGAPVTSVGGSSVGNLGSATNRVYRCVGAFAGTSIAMNFSPGLVSGVDITGVGGSACIRVNAISTRMSISNVTGTTGNTGPGLLLDVARACQILMGTLGANTFAGAAGQDIEGFGGAGTFFVHADYARTDIRDAGGNHIQGGGNVIIGPTTRLANNAVATIGQYNIVRVTATNLVQRALADTAANAAGVVGVCQGVCGTTEQQMFVTGGSTWVQFDGVPVAGAIAYLSVGTLGNATTTIPPLAATNQKLRLGRVMRVLGTLGLINWNPEALSVLADGAA